MSRFKRSENGKTYLTDPRYSWSSVGDTENFQGLELHYAIGSQKIFPTMKGRIMNAGVTVFIPLYNEEAILENNVRTLCEQMESLNLRYEIILGSNGSTDRTPSIGEKLAHAAPYISFFHLAERGPGLAFAEALPRVRYEYLVCVDADLSTNFDFVPRAIEALTTYDAVVGSKQTGDQHRPWLRVAASNLFIVCTNWLLKMPYHDYSISAKAYRTAAILPFVEQVDRHTFYTQTLLYQLQRQGRKILEIPVTCEDLRQSRFNLLHEGVYRYSKLVALWCGACVGKRPV